jgi:drug/metabolite transporter (DMT)-like permease
VGPVLALAAACAFGMSDFAGGLAARRASALTVTGGAQLAGLAILLPALVLLPGRASSGALVVGALAGLLGASGLVLYLRCMAIGPMGVVSPLAALVGVAVPVTWGVLLAGERLSGAELGGIALGALAVGCVAYVRGRTRMTDLRGPVLALASGAAFGGFFVALDASPVDSGLWPLLGARVAGLALLAGLLLLTPRRLPGAATWRLIVVSGTLDMTANVLFLLATRADLLSLSAVLASLYPVVVVVLARQVLAERLTRLQSIGVAAALGATALIVAS